MLNHTFVLEVPFPTEKHASIAAQTLSPDPILKADELTVDYTAEGSLFKAKFAGVSDRVLRVAISNMIDNLKTIVECIDEFDGKKDVVFL